MNKPLLDIRNLIITTENNAKSVINDVSLTLERGDILALIGASGSGKTTLALTALGHLRPGLKHQSGQVKLDGIQMLSLPAPALRQLRGKKVAYVAQSAAAAFNPRVILDDQIIEPSVIHHSCSQQEALARARSICNSLGLPAEKNLGKRFPHQVSGGQLQRFMIAMGLQELPDLLVCDEPTSALDVTTQVEVLKALKIGIEQHGTGAIFVSHDLAVVAQIATRIAVLRHGKIVEIGNADQVLNAPTQAYTRELIETYRRFEYTDRPARPGKNSGAPLLRLSGVKIGYGPLTQTGPAMKALHEVNLELNRGEMVAVIGESGSGKSTLARAIGGLVAPYAGTIELDGTPLPGQVMSRSTRDRRRIQLVFQSADTALNQCHNVGKILGRVLDFFGTIKASRRAQRVHELLEMVQLSGDYVDRKPAQLSGGEKQRVNLARALAAEPDILICDEITSALDNVVAASILALVDDLRERLQLAIIFVSHDLAAVASLSDQVMVLRHGHVVEQGMTASILRHAQHPYTRLLKSSIPELRQGWLEEAAAEHEILRHALTERETPNTSTALSQAAAH